MLWLDLETRSQCCLKSRGLYQYARHETTDVICMSYAFDDNPVTTWFSEDAPFPASVLDYIKNGGPITAHNAAFERQIFENVLKIDVALTQWRCSSARALARSLPASLGNLCIALDLPIQKQKEGARLIREYSAPGFLTQWKPGDKEIMRDYCEMDVATMRMAMSVVPDITSDQWRQYHITEDINDHGVPVDIQFAAAALERSEEIRADVNAQLCELTDGCVQKHTARKDRDAWFMREFEEDHIKPLIKNEKIAFDKEKRSALLSNPETPDRLRRFAELIEDAGGSTVAKYKSMSDTHVSNRVRGSLIWSGAGSTGRFSSRGLQLQNFKRNVFENPQEQIDLVLAGAPLHKPSDTLARLVRSAIHSPHGLTWSDYSQIEARVLPWLSNDSLADDLLQVFRAGGDIYMETANRSPIFQQMWDPRQAAKQGVLACLHPASKVVTSNGVKRLIDVELSDKLWDGSAWVAHSGVVYRGYKPIIDVGGLWATKDHLVKTGQTWKQAKELVSNQNTLKSARETGLAALKSLGLTMAPPGVCMGSKCNVTVAPRRIWSWTTVYEKGPLLNAMCALKKVVQNLTQNTAILSRIKNTAEGYLAAYLHVYNAVLTRSKLTTPIMAVEAYKCTKNGWLTGGCFLNTSLPLMDGTTQKRSSTGWITGAAMSLETWLLYLSKLITSIDAQSASCRKGSTNWSHVYDIAHAGPNNCFTVLTDSGALVVHNCGFGGGRRAVQNMARNYGIKLPEEDAQAIVDAYRQANPWAKPFWFGLARAAQNAVLNPGQVFTQGRLSFLYNYPDWLWMQLPSGRVIAYPQPRWEMDQAPWEDEPSEKLTVLWGSGKRKAGQPWPRRALSHIILSENATQGAAADLMREAIVRAYDADLPVLFSVHDELVVEGHCADKLTEVMITAPAWADGLPIDADTVEGVRYGK